MKESGEEPFIYTLSANKQNENENLTRSCFCVCIALSEGCFSSVGHLDPLGVGRGLGVVGVVPVPPLVRRRLRVARRRVLPLLLAPERSDVEVSPRAPHRLVAAVVDEVGSEHVVAVADERIRTVPLVHAEVGVEAVLYRVPGHLPVHSCFEAFDVSLRRAGGESEGGVARIQMGEVGDLVGQKGATSAGMFRPAEDAWLEEGAVDDQLTAAIEQVEQAHPPFGPIELVFLFHSEPWHPPALGGQRVTGPGQRLLFYEELQARSLPLRR